MTWLIGWIGVGFLIEGFDHKTFTTQNQWEVGVGLALIALAVVLRIWGDDD